MSNWRDNQNLRETAEDCRAMWKAWAAREKAFVSFKDILADPYGVHARRRQYDEQKAAQP